AVGRTKGNLVQVNLLANTDLRSAEEFNDLIVADRGGAIVRLSDVARIELGAEEADMVAKLSDREAVYLGVWPLVGSNEIVVVENVERHVRQGKSRIDAALIGARELLGPIVAMTITLAVVYAPIGFQGGLTGSLFLEFAFTLAAAVVVSGVVAVTLSPVMS